jgi:prepilin-type N-terminal cleavage/methylation domain-containing protein
MGMTLIELLVVIGVIAVIIGITYRALSQARERAHLATCISNLRQLVLAVHMYEQDWGIVPIEKPTKTEEGWYGYVQQMLFPYIQDTSVFICPVAKGRWFTEPIWKGKKWTMCYAYYVNDYVVNKYGKGNPRLKHSSPLFSCFYHENLKVILIARYNGMIEVIPPGLYKAIHAEFDIEKDEGENEEFL